MDKETDTKLMKEKCQSIYMNLLLSGLRDVSASTYLKEWNETKRCDTLSLVVDLKSIREANERYIEEQSKGTMERILTGNVTREDEQRAMNCAYHYKFYHDRQLLQALEWHNWASYHVFHKPIETASLLTIFGLTVKWAMIPLANMKRVGEKLTGAFSPPPTLR